MIEVGFGGIPIHGHTHHNTMAQIARSAIAAASESPVWMSLATSFMLRSLQRILQDHVFELTEIVA